MVTCAFTLKPNHIRRDRMCLRRRAVRYLVTSGVSPLGRNKRMDSREIAFLGAFQQDTIAKGKTGGIHAMCVRVFVAIVVVGDCLSMGLDGG